MILLDIGCGKMPRNGYIGVDIVHLSDRMVLAEMYSLPFCDNSIDGIYSSHALEHIPKALVVPTLNEWCRILKYNAIAEIHVPDLEWCCREWLKHLSNDWWMDIIFGNQEHEGEFHKTGFTFMIMEKYIRQTKFELLSWTEAWSHDQETMIFQLRKEPR